MVAGESNFSQKICTIHSSSIHTKVMARSYIYTIMICLFRILNSLLIHILDNTSLIRSAGYRTVEKRTSMDVVGFYVLQF